MDQITMSSKGQIAIPKKIRDALNLCEGSKLTLEVRGHDIVLAKASSWRSLEGSLAANDTMDDFAEFRKRERELEDSGS